MAQDLAGQNIAILVADGFEEGEMTEPRKALEQAGAETRIVSPAGEVVRAWDFKDWSGDYRADQPLGTARAEDFDALL